MQFILNRNKKIGSIDIKKKDKNFKQIRNFSKSDETLYSLVSLFITSFTQFSTLVFMVARVYNLRNTGITSVDCARYNTDNRAGRINIGLLLLE